VIAWIISSSNIGPSNFPALLSVLGFVLIIPGVLVGYIIPSSTQGLGAPIIYSVVVWFAVGMIAALVGRSNLTRLLIWCGMVSLIALFGFVAFFFVFSA
jgi:hypothetical protein